jgi:hypothetical protein
VVGYNVPAAAVLVRDAQSGRRCACPRSEVCPSRAPSEAGVGAAGVDADDTQPLTTTERIPPDTADEA